MFYKQNHYLIVGANSKTGKSLIHFFSEENIIYSVSDIKRNFFISLIKNPLKTPPINIYDSPNQDNKQLNHITHIIIAPGVPRTIPLLQKAKEQQIPIDTDIAFTLNVLKERKIFPSVLGITGSIGKTTTVNILYNLLQKGYHKGQTYLVGNVGTPILDYFNQYKTQDIIILELSSYQLEDAEKYSLTGACILNIIPNHLDRYDSFLDYEQTKEKIFLTQTSEGFSVINVSQPQYKNWIKKSRGKVLKIGNKNSEGLLYSITPEKNIEHKNQPFIYSKDLLIKAPHMLENMCVALAFSSYFKVPELIQKEVLYQFKGLEHRSELVKILNNISFINDSKSTTPESIVPHLHNTEYKGIVMIIGGKNKNLDFSILNHQLDNVKHIIYYGESGLEIQKQIQYKDYDYINDFTEAIKKSYQVALKSKASAVILSPGCASFDQFSSYEKRGACFKKIVNELL